MEINNIEEFKTKKYLLIPSLIPRDLCRIATKYALLKEKVEFSPEEGLDAQVEGAHSVYGDTLMETLMFFTKPHLEKATGLELVPTYTYYRVYRPGSILARHKDRPSCEVSVTICLGRKYIHQDTNFEWNMFVDPESPQIPLGVNGEFVSNNKPGIEVSQNIGDGLIYRGCELEHWRDKFLAEKDSYQVQVFFHYINKNGPFYPELVYDKRPGLGFRDKYRNN